MTVSTDDTAAGGSPSTGLCVLCQSPVRPGEPNTNCPDCRAPYHQECWDYNHGCGVYGCRQVPPAEKLANVEIPASYWGQDDKSCPRCGKTIMAAAVRCRSCGAVFSSARPQNATEYYSRSAIERALPRVRKTGIWILILGVIPCTAPFAAVFGLIWYMCRRREIRALSSLSAAICLLGVLIAVGQTALATTLTLLYGALRG